MFRDGNTRGIETVPYPNTAFVAVKANVKPRTNDKDPISKRGSYSCWIMMKNSDEGSIQSAYCSCKQGCCRHVVATLFKVLDFEQDFRKTSCTSGPCMLVRRASQADQLGKPIPASQLETSIMVEPSTQTAMPLYSPLSDEYPVPDPNDFLEKVKTLQPTACGLGAMYDCSYKKNCTSSPLSVKTPMERAEQFMKEYKCENISCNCSNIFMYYYLTYSENECEQIEQLTIGQSKNNNWYRMGKELLTASNFHKITHSTDLNRTAIALQKKTVFAEHSMPDSILFGQRFENKARDIFIKTHRFKHKHCSVKVPGLVISNEDQILACSPDGIVDCKICGKFLIEINCLYKYKCFHPKNALKLSNVCVEDENNNLTLRRSHTYFDQVQGQMGVTGLTKCVLVGYTHKGVCSITIDFDESFWNNSKIIVKVLH